MGICGACTGMFSGIRKLALLPAAVLLTVLPVSASATEFAHRAQFTTVAKEQAADSTWLELYAQTPGVNERLEAENLFPGDVLEKEYAVQAWHTEPLTQYFKITLTQQTQGFGDVLDVIVVDTQQQSIIYDGPFSQLDGKVFEKQLPVSDMGFSLSTYQVRVSMDTSAGNEYQRALLMADFQWYLEETSALPEDSDSSQTPEDSTPANPPKDPSSSDSSDTGVFSRARSWYLLLMGAVALLLVGAGKGRKEKRHAGQ